MKQYLVLASGSPRRRELLAAAGYEFRVIVADESVEASVSQDLTPEQFVAEASLRKARHVATELESEIVVAADTIAALNQRIIGKPIDRDHARKILLTLQNTTHYVLTGLTIWETKTSNHLTHVESTELFMSQLTDQQVEEYLDTNQWVGKAGAFGYQDGLDWVTITHGLESNVVGLPVELIPDLIAKLTS